MFEENNCAPLGVIYTASKGNDPDRFNFGFTVVVSDVLNLVTTIPNDEIEEFQWVDLSQIAIMSGDRASYTSFQAILLGEIPAPAYIEIGV